MAKCVDDCSCGRHSKWFRNEDEFRARMAEAARNRSPEHRENLGRAFRGRSIPLEQREKIRATLLQPERRAATIAALVGHPVSPATREKLRKAIEKPWESKGYGAKHAWVRERFEDPGACEDCGATSRLEWASINHTYTQRREDWRRLCVRCHHRMDR